MFFLCLRRNVRARDQRQASLEEHLTWMRAQHESGRILLSGPTPDRAVGIYLIRAATQDAAQEVADSDPYTAAGDTDYELIAWDIRQVLGVGSFNGSAAQK